jgi:dienelactone hydrolase
MHFPQTSLGTVVFLLPMLGAGLAAEDTPRAPAATQAWDDRMHDYLKRETNRLSERFLNGARTRQQWEDQRPKLHRDFLDMLGLWPLPEKTPLRATITGQLENDGVLIEKLQFQSRPGLYVTCNLYRPAAVKAKLPAILYVCGHSGRGRDGNKTAFQDHGLWFAKNGYVCLVIDTLQLGEVAGKHHGTYNLNRWWWHSAGYTPAGVECWNGIRAIDYLLTRPEVDGARIGVTGISGGGASTFWIAAADERVQCAVPVSGMSDLESYVPNKVINGHCDCMFVVNSHGWEWTTIAALIAPRPLLFANSDNDPIFPMDGNRRIIARLRQLYDLLEKPSLVDDHVSKGGHDYRPDLRLAVFHWFNRHLKNDTSPLQDADPLRIPGRELRVFPEDSDLPKDSINARIDETFVPRAAVKIPEQGSFDQWKSKLSQSLRQRVFQRFPERVPAPIEAKIVKGKKGHWLLTTEPGMELTMFTKAEGKVNAQLAILVVLNQDEEASAAVPAWAAPYCGTEGMVDVLKPRGGWEHKSPPNYVERAHALLGQTVDQGRVWDVAATARLLTEQGTRRKVCRVIGRRQAGILAAYAALFEPAIADVVVVDPPASHLEGPHFLGVLRVLDIADALGMVAPRTLTLAGAPEGVRRRVEEVYQRAGVVDRLTVKMP